MNRHTAGFLLALTLWVASLTAYAGSLALPWFTLTRGVKVQVNDRSQTQISGHDAFDFLFDRLGGGSFVWLAHPVLWTGWLLLVCRRWRGASIAGCFALVLALNAPLVFQPREGPWLPPGLGYYLWFASLALLASSSVAHGRFFRDDRFADRASLRQLADRQSAAADELAELKHQVAVLFDHQAVAFLDQIEDREPGEFSRFQPQ